MTGVVAKIGLGMLFDRVKAKAAPALGFVTAIPRPVWEGITVIGYGLALLFLHQHYAHVALSAADKAGYDRARTEDAAALKTLHKAAQAVTQAGQKIATETRTRNDQDNSAIHAAAGGLLPGGPGAASCRRVGDPAVPAAGGEPHQAGNQPGDAARGQVPAGDGNTGLAAVPWNWLVGRAEQCDLDRAEALTWRDWYQQQAKAWEQLHGDKPTSQ